MRDSFEKIKRRYLIRAIAAGVAGGVAAGLICVGSVLLACKLNSVNLHAGYYVLIGLLPALAVGALLFLLLRPDDRRLAEKLDGKYGLRERVQTMLAYGAEEGVLPELQRQDASERLHVIYEKQPRFRGLWKYVALPVAAVALFFTAIFVPSPAVAPSQGVPDDYYEFTDWQKTALEQLIAEVRDSSLETTLKDGVCGSLNGLLDALDETNKRTEMLAYVAAAAEVTEEILVKSASYDKIGVQFAKSQTTLPLALAVSDGLFTFRSFGEIRSFDSVKKIEEGLEGTVGKKVSARTSGLRASLAIKQEEGLADLVRALREMTNSSLAASGVASFDALYTAFADFSGAVFAIEEILGGSYGDETIQSRVDAAFSDLDSDLTVEVRAQAYRCVMNEYVHNRLREIFAISSAELPDTVYGSGGGAGDQDPDRPNIEPGDPDDPDNNNGGGYGDGDNRYGSDDMVYDPDRDEYVKYGEIVNAFRAKALEQMRNGAVSEETEKLVNGYFDLLLSGIKESEENENNEN